MRPIMALMTTLYRPVGQKEPDLIEASEWKRFPPRLEWQPIFYPVLNENYATRIAAEWNTKDVENGSVGFALKFDVAEAFLESYNVEQVGDAECLEYWIPSEHLDAFNDAIEGTIEIISEWRGDPPVVVRFAADE